MKWYNKITTNPDDLTPLIDAINYFNSEVEKAMEETKINGIIAEEEAKLSGIFAYRFRQYQEIEAIMKYLEIKMVKIKGSRFKHYLESYNKQMSSRDAEKYAEADDEVLEIALLINHIALIRNYYQAVSKGLDIKHWQLGNITKMKCAGIEDYAIFEQ